MKFKLQSGQPKIVFSRDPLTKNVRFGQKGRWPRNLFFGEKAGGREVLEKEASSCLPMIAL